MPLGKKPIDPMIRLWSHVDKAGPIQPHMDTPCWIWTAKAQVRGRGYMGIGSLTDGTRQRRLCSHLVYESEVGPITPGLFVLHRCDVAACLNPAHLFLGTQAENMRDMVAKGRHVKGSLSHDVVRAIRRDYGKRGRGGMTMRELAVAHGLSRHVVRCLLERKTYSYVE